MKYLILMALLVGCNNADSSRSNREGLGELQIRAMKSPSRRYCYSLQTGELKDSWFCVSFIGVGKTPGDVKKWRENRGIPEGRPW